MSSPPSLPKLSQSYIEEYCGNRLMIIAIAFIVLDSTFVALRCWSRQLQKASMGWDDILIMPAYFSCLSLCICGILSVKYGGVGYHQEVLIEFAPEKFQYWSRICLIAVPVFYALSSTLPKLVILAVYLRVFVSKWSRTACYAIGAVLVASCIINMILSIFQCTQKDWVHNTMLYSGYCRKDINIQAHIRWGQFPNVVTDIAMLILPLPVVWKLNIPQRVKFGVMATFAVGSIGLITATIRFVAYLSTAAFADATWTSVKLVGWTCIEPGVYLIAACLLACRPLLQQTLHSGGGFWSQLITMKSKRYSDISTTTTATARLNQEDIEMQATTTTPTTTKHPFTIFHNFDNKNSNNDKDRDDPADINKTPTANSKAGEIGNSAGASAQQQRHDIVDPFLRTRDGIHVKREVVLRSDEVGR